MIILSDVQEEIETVFDGVLGPPNVCLAYAVQGA